MAISRQDVAKVARLAALELTEAEVDRMTADLGKVLEHFASLEGLDTTGVPPASDLLAEAAPLRADEVRPGVGPQAALANAPAAEDGAFAVPRILATDGRAGKPGARA